MLNVALFGFGRIGQMHAKNIYKNRNLRLFSVYEKSAILKKKSKEII